MLAVEQEISCSVGACGLCVGRQCTARLDGIIPSDLECPGYLAHRMVDSDSVQFLRLRAYQQPQNWWPMRAGEPGGSNQMFSEVFRGC